MFSILYFGVFVCDKMKARQYLWFHFYFFSLLKMSDIETYGSDKLQVDCLHDERGKKIKTDGLFFNLYEFWTLLHASHKSLFKWYHPKVAKLEKKLRK